MSLYEAGLDERSKSQNCSAICARYVVKGNYEEAQYWAEKAERHRIQAQEYSFTWFDLHPKLPHLFLKGAEQDA